MGWSSSRAMLVARAVALAVVFLAAEAQLSPGYYNATCPGVVSIVRRGMAQAVQKESRMGASILRLFFHDCFVNGCDASILLDDTANFTGEKNAGPNANSVRGYEVIDAIKAQLEASCKATVSCADIITLAARDAVNLVSICLVFFCTHVMLALMAGRVQLGGPNTVGWARCSTFRTHIYNDTGVNATFASQLRTKSCPTTGGDGNLAPLELQAPNTFDNAYFTDLLSRRVLLRSDQELFGSGAGNGTTDAFVRAYAANATTFAADFAAAMVRLGNLSPLTGKNGEVRINCRRVNSS
uniref:Peroxidase n=1 Tax=Oryza barthii TaxID=65489 RepID=A0A0D3EKW8_9ORYZ